MLLKIMVVLATVIAVLAGFSAQSLLTAVGVWLGAFLLLLLAALAVLAIACAVVDYDVPQEEDSTFYRKLAGVYIEFLIGALRVRVHPRGMEQKPTEGRFLLVCNHLFDADPGIVLHYFKDSQLAFISKKENRRLPFVGKVMHKLQCQLLDREDDRQALRVILKCVELIKQDKCSIAVFPEGYCAKDNKLHPFRPGVFKIAMKTKVPIVVCTITGTRSIIPNVLKLKPSDVDFHLVRVIQPEEYAGMKTTELSDMVHDLMAKDLGEDYLP